MKMADVQLSEISELVVRVFSTQKGDNFSIKSYEFKHASGVRWLRKPPTNQLTIKHKEGKKCKRIFKK